MFCRVGFVLPQSVEKLCNMLTRAHWPPTDNAPLDQEIRENRQIEAWSDDLLERYLADPNTQLFLAGPDGQIMRVSQIVVERVNAPVLRECNDEIHKNLIRTMDTRFLHLDRRTFTVDWNRNHEICGVYDEEKCKPFNSDQMRAFKPYQGWSLCLKEDLVPTKPSDLEYLTRWPDQISASTKGPGRPKKVDQFAQWIVENVSDVVRQKMKKKALLQMVCKGVGFDLSMETLNRALAIVGANYVE